MVAIIISVPYDAHMSLQLQQIIFRLLAPSIGEKMLVFTLHMPLLDILTPWNSNLSVVPFCHIC